MLTLTHTLPRTVFAALGVAAILLVPVVIGAKMYGRRQRQLGLWDEDGPLHPTRPPVDESTKYLRRLTGDDWRPY